MTIKYRRRARPGPRYMARTTIRRCRAWALSYAGQLNLDIVADATLVPDLTVFANGMIKDLERLGARPPVRE